MSENPYTPAAEDAPPTGDLAVLYLQQTRPWLFVVSTLMFLGSGLMVLLGVMLAVIGSFAGALADDPAFNGFGPVIGVVYGAVGLLYMAPAALLFQQALAIGRVETGADAVAEVLRHNRNFWRFVGGMALTIIALYCGGIGLFVVVSAAGVR